MTFHKQMNQALVLAAEYRDCCQRGEVARLPQIRSTIDDLVGYFADGKLRLPANVREAMGLEA